MPTARKAPAPPAAPRRFPPALGWIVPLLAALALVLWDAHARIQRSLELSRHYGVAVRAPAPDATSPTGYALGRRSLVAPLTAPDALHWVMQTQAMAARGEVRVRHVDYDNAPRGRDVHWGSPLRWWLLALARLDQAVLGTPAPIAIERSALWAGPALFVLALAAAAPFLARRFGALGASAVIAGCLSCEPLTVLFVAGNADHHGPVVLTAFASVVLLVTGVQAQAASRRRWFAGSALAGALGLWISAASLVPVLIGIGLGALGAALLERRHSAATPAAEADLAGAWRWWGMIGGLATLFAWCIEYLPDHAAWRLEVIHPLYAVAWWAGGELLARLSDAAGDPRTLRSARVLAFTALAAVGVALPALVIAARGADVFLVSDSFLQRLHGDYIAEFQSIVRYVRERPLDAGMVARFGPAVLLVLALVFLARGPVDRGTRTGLALAGGAALALFALAAVQIRWWGLASALGLIAVALAARALGSARQRTVGAVLVFALTFPGLIQAMRAASLAREPTASDIRRLAERDLAHRLRVQAGDSPLAIAATPDETTSLVYFAAARGVGTMYWENLDGLRAIAALLGAASHDAAHRIIQERHLTHLVLFSWDPSDASCVRLHRHLRPGAPVPREAWVERVKRGDLPPWLRPVAHRLPDHPMLRDEVIRVFEVVEPRDEARQVVDTAVYLMDMGRANEAAALEPALAAHPGDLAAQATLALLQARRQDARAFGATLARILDLRERRGVAGLDDRLRVATALAIGGRTGPAADELRHALLAADETAVRRLGPGALADLLEVSRALGVTWPDPALEALAIELVPPAAASRNP